MRRHLPTLTLLLALFAAGCGGGLDCPFDRPPCCGTVFGCGPFELPAGCSCNDYLLRSFGGAILPNQRPQTPILSKAAPAPTPAASGTWRVTGRRVSSSGCPLFPQTNTSTVTVRDESGRISVNAPGLVTLRGLRTGNTVSARGALKLPALQCEAFITANMDITSTSNAPQTVLVDYRCARAANSCSVTYRGTAKRLG